MAVSLSGGSVLLSGGAVRCSCCDGEPPSSPQIICTSTNRACNSVCYYTQENDCKKYKTKTTVFTEIYTPPPTVPPSDPNCTSEYSSSHSLTRTTVSTYNNEEDCQSQTTTVTCTGETSSQGSYRCEADGVPYIDVSGECLGTVGNVDGNCIWDTTESFTLNGSTNSGSGNFICVNRDYITTTESETFSGDGDCTAEVTYGGSCEAYNFSINDNVATQSTCLIVRYQPDIDKTLTITVKTTTTTYNKIPIDDSCEELWEYESGPVTVDVTTFTMFCPANQVTESEPQCITADSGESIQVFATISEN